MHFMQLLNNKKNKIYKKKKYQFNKKKNILNKFIQVIQFKT